MAKETKKVLKTCQTCGIQKYISPRRKNCNECLAERREVKWQKEKERICDNPEPNRSYMLSIPVATDFEGNPRVCCFVHPFKEYRDGILGIDLMRNYLSKRWKKGTIPLDKSVVDYHYDNKERYGDISYADIRTATRIDNEKDDITFKEYKKKLDSFTDKKQKNKYKASLRIKKIEEFKYQNEGDRIQYKDLTDKRKKEIKEQEDADEGDWELEDVD